MYICVIGRKKEKKKRKRKGRKGRECEKKSLGLSRFFHYSFLNKVDAVFHKSKYRGHILFFLKNLNSVLHSPRLMRSLVSVFLGV